MTNTISGMNIFISSMYLSRKHKLFLKALLAARSKNKNKNKEINWLYVDVLDDKCEQAALLVDIDDSEGKKYWENSIKQQTLPSVVAFTSSNGLGEKYPVVHKPLRSRELFSVLLKTAQTTSIKAKAKLDETLATDLSTPEVISEIIKPVVAINSHRQESMTVQAITEGELVLQYILCKQKKFFQIIDGGKKLLINYERNLCYSNEEPHLLSNIFLKPVADVKLKELTCADEYAMQYKASVVDLYPVLWNAIINCSKEQLFESIKNNTPVKLNKWPDYKFLMNNPVHMKLSAILSKRWSNAQNLAQEANISLQDVSKFINACYGLKYLIFDESKIVQKANKIIELKNKKNKAGLFNKIRKRLGI